MASTPTSAKWRYLFGCPVAPLFLDLPDPDSAPAVACQEAVEEWCAIYADALAAAGVAGSRAKSLATVAISAVEGALLLARARRDVTPLHDVAGELEVLIRGALPAGAGATRS